MWHPFFRLCSSENLNDSREVFHAVKGASATTHGGVASPHVQEQSRNCRKHWENLSWWNWQTRMLQEHVPVMGLGVRLSQRGLKSECALSD
jgi:hypothetical protein